MPLARIPSWALLAALVVGSAALRFAGATGMPTPWITPDETLYGILGRSLWRDGELAVVGEPVPFYSFLHPLLVGLPLALWDGVTGYRVAQAVSALAMSSTAVPVFLWGRRLMRDGWALVAAALTVAIPGVALSGLLMTETVFYPVVALAAWAFAAALERPTLLRQAAVVAAIAAACLTRPQALILVPALASAACVAAGLLRDRRVLVRLWPAASGLAAFGLAWAVASLRRESGNWSRTLGGYQSAAESSYPLDRTIEDVLRHIGGVVWIVGLVPVVALVVLLALAVRARPPAGEAALLAVAASLALWVGIEVGVVATGYVEAFGERYLLSTAPPLFLVLCLWLDRGAPRPRLVTGAAAVGALLLVLLIPFDDWVRVASLPNAPSFTVLWREDAAEAGWILPAVAAALTALLPRRLLPLLPALLLAGFAVSSVAAADHIERASRLLRTQLVGPGRTWVDDRVGRDGATYVYDGEANWNAVWEHVFWNTRITSVADLPNVQVNGPMPQIRLRIAPDGSVSPEPHARHAVVSSFFELRGERVAEAVQRGIGQRALVLWRLDGPLRLGTRLTGVQANGDVFGAGRLTVWDCRAGRPLLLTLLGKSGRPIQLLQDDRAERTVELAPGESTFVTVPARPRTPGGVCTFDVTSDGLFGTTQFRYER
ncbi:MAG TPA: glycosyltransferase family 39 protein [Gaiellaceae bacterium]|nr:glycosyltransferase family 39 protein [Gaiellaceae bacterium]